MLKILTLGLCMIALHILPVYADETADLRALTQQRFDANSAGDRSFYERLLMPNFILQTPFAPPQTKQEYLDVEFIANSTAPRGGKATISDFRALVDGSTAVTTYQVTEPSTFGEQHYESHSMRVDTYVKIDTIWRLLSMTVTTPPTWPEVAVIDTQIYREYVGTYELSPQVQIIISTDSGHLFLDQAGLPKIELLPENQTSFFDRTDNPAARNIFERDSSGKVVALLYRSANQQVRAKKVK